MRVAIVFPGQGTQAAGMGRPWKGHGSWPVVDAAEHALGTPLAPLLLDAPAEQLGRTREAQLAVLTTSLIAWDAARAAIETRHEIVGFAGHSLGQVTALIASGAMSIDDGVRFARQRAELTQAAADAHPGRMAALVGASIEQAQGACTAAPDAAWVANDNAPGQVVIAGTPEGLDAATAHAKTLGVRKALPLPVGGAFHTPLMRDACAGLEAMLASVALQDPAQPIVSNDDAEPYATTEGWPVRLVRHPTVTVQWRASMLALVEQLGAQAFIEVGHGSMIAGVAKRTVPSTPVIGIAAPSDIDLLTASDAPRDTETTDASDEGSSPS
ncbi:MAG TPA: ACP S-malonyltransferase [Acidimicrobiia bacterium]